MNGLLTVSMIVKNEERFLPECLSSVKDVADEIIVVDTGSTDRTVEIARSFGARVIEIEWPDDFSAARNVGLDLVKTPWVLVMDADEELIPDDIPTLTQAIKTPIADGYNIRIVSVMDQAQDISESYVLRLFRSHPKVRFEGKVHEQVFQALGRQRMQVAPINARLLHKGYLNAIMESRDKTKRNRVLLEKHLQEQPDDGYMLWQLAQTLVGAADFKSALTIVRKSLRNLPVSHPIWVLAQTTYARVLALNGEPKRAIKVLQEGQQAYPGYTDFHHLEGIFRLNLQQWRLAEASFRKCLEIGEAQGFLMTDTGVGGFKSYYRLAHALTNQGRSKEALAYLLMAIKNTPPFREAWNGVFSLLAGSTFESLLDTILLVLPLDNVIAELSGWPDLNPDEERLLETAKQRRAPIQQN